MSREREDARRYLRSLGLQRPIDILRIFDPLPPRILIVGMQRLGDLIVILPAIREIRSAFPQSKITVMSAPEHRELAVSQRLCDSFHPLPLDSTTFNEIARSYDLMFVFRDWYDLEYTYQEGPVCYTFTTDILLGKPKWAHLHYLDAMRMLGFRPRPSSPQIAVPPKQKEFARRLLESYDTQPGQDVIVAVHPGSGYEGKRWPEERFAAVCKHLQECYNMKFLILQGPEDGDTVKEDLWDLLPGSFQVIGGLPLLELAALLENCAFYFGNDSGVMHLADAVSVPMVAIFGPSRPGVWGPVHPKSISLVREDVWEYCPYCSGRQFKDMPCRRGGESSCLTSISVADAIGAIETLISTLQLRGTSPALDAIKLSRSLIRIPFGDDRLVLCNPDGPRPLFVLENRRIVESALHTIQIQSSFRRLVEDQPRYRSLLDLLFAYRVLLPGKAGEPRLTKAEIDKTMRVLSHPAFIDFSVRCLAPPEDGCGNGEGHGDRPDFARSSAGSSKMDEKPKRIVMVNSIHPSIYGGGERWAIKTGKELVARGHEVYCWGIAEHEWLKDAQKEGLLLMERPIPLAFNYLDLPDLVAELEALHLDGAILNLDRDLIFSGLPLRLAGVGVIALRKGLENLDLPSHMRWAYQTIPHGVIVPSLRMKEVFVDEGVFGPAAVWHIPNGTHLTELAPGRRQRAENLRDLLHIDRTDICILCVGRLTRQKGVSYLIEAMPQILKRHPNARLLIIGKGEMQRQLRKTVRRLGLADEVLFLGERWNCADFYAAADVFVLPSLYEGMSNVLLEAMAAGLPVVATRVSGSDEVIRHDMSGLLVSPGDSSAIADAVKKIIGLGCRDSHLAAHGKSRIREQYSLDNTVDSIEMLFDHSRQ